MRPQAVDLEVHHVKNSPECGDKRAAFEKLEETMKELQQHVEALGKLFSPTSPQILKGLGHEIRIALKWYGLIGLG